MWKYENSVLGRFGQLGLQRKNIQTATSEGRFFMFSWAKNNSDFFKDTLVSALKNYLL